MKARNITLAMFLATFAIASFLSFAAHAQDANESAFDSEAEAKVEALDDKSDALTIENEINEANKIGYEDVGTRTSREAKDMQVEVRRLERSLSQTKNGIERAKRQAELAEKRLALQKQLKKDAGVRLAQAQKIKKLVERRHAQLAAQAKAIQAKAEVVKERRMAAGQTIAELEKENAELNKRLAAAKKQIAQEQKRRDSLRAKQTKLAKQNSQLKTQVARAEKRK